MQQDNVISKAVQLEHLRTNLALKRDYARLITTYKFSRFEIPNLNTGWKWNKLNRASIVKSKNPMAYDRVLRVVSELKGENLTILDVGFGQGMLEKIVREKRICKELWGIDIAAKSVVGMNEEYKREGWKFINGDITRIGLPAGYFDYVIAMEVLEHISPSKTLSVLRKLYSSLKSSGMFLVSVPLNEGLEHMLLRGNNPNAHVRIYSPELIKAELEISGFRVVRSYALFAFHQMYTLKSLFNRIIPIRKRPNIITLISKKQ